MHMDRESESFVIRHNDHLISFLKLLCLLDCDAITVAERGTGLLNESA